MTKTSLSLSNRDLLLNTFHPKLSISSIAKKANERILDIVFSIFPPISVFLPFKTRREIRGSRKI